MIHREELPIAVPLNVVDLSHFTTPELGAVKVVASSLCPAEEVIAQVQPYLSPDESAKQQRFLPPEVKRRYGVCRGRLRQLLGAMLNVPPATIQFEYNANGKPRLATSHRSFIEFNVSHSGDWALFAFATNLPVGIDIELFQRKTNFEALASQILSAKERKLLESIEPAECNLAIMHAWVAKEAVLKAIGVGIGYGLHAAEFRYLYRNPVVHRESIRCFSRGWMTTQTV